MPPLFVTEAVKGAPWQYAAIPGAEVLSRCSDYTTSQFLQDYRRLSQLLGLLVPDNLRVQMSVPTTFILYRQDDQQAFAREVVQSVWRAEIEKTTGTAGAGFNSAAREPGDRADFLPNLMLADTDAQMGFAMLPEWWTKNPGNLTLAVDQVRYLLERRVPPLPRWFVEGVLDLFGQALLGNGSIEIRPATWVSQADTDGLKKDRNYPRALLPLEEMLNDAHANPSDPNSPLWRLQASLVVRWGLAGKNLRVGKRSGGSPLAPVPDPSRKKPSKIVSGWASPM